ncbi:MAG: hypothetical protein KAV82_12880 [Phycisphaerae bacterium]|nr:hypothetical protein [Phycisphaerae bacterium]
MRNHRCKRFVMLGLVVTTGMVFAGSGLACASLAFDQAAESADFCFLFDCRQGAYGGLVDFCDPDNPESSLLADCRHIDFENQN